MYIKIVKNLGLGVPCPWLFGVFCANKSLRFGFVFFGVEMGVY